MQVTDDFFKQMLVLLRDLQTALLIEMATLASESHKEQNAVNLTK